MGYNLIMAPRQARRRPGSRKASDARPRITSSQKAKTIAAEADRLSSERLSIMAHEMRTPLTSIKGYATALLMEETRFDAESQREFLQNIDAECDNLIRIIEDLLESSTLDSGVLELEMEPVSLPQVAKHLVEEMNRPNPRHRFVVDFAAAFPDVTVDRYRIRQVLRNLLENAIKYSPQGGLIVVQGEAKGNEIVLSVADQGIGIAPEHLNRLFDKFFRIKSSASGRISGSGLGLPIARKIVESHGGRIWAESQPGRGSTFYFTLPLKQVVERQVVRRQHGR